MNLCKEKVNPLRWRSLTIVGILVYREKTESYPCCGSPGSTGQGGAAGRWSRHGLYHGQR